MDPMDKIYQKYAQYVFKYLMSLTHDRDVAEELTQETFYQAIKSIHRYDESCKISTWLVAIAKNQYHTYLRKNPVHESMDESYEDGSPKEYTSDSHSSAEGEVLTQANRIQMLKLLHNCEEPYKEIIYLRMYEGLSFKDIGEIMGKTENWARVSFYRGKEKLKKQYELLK